MADETPVTANPTPTVTPTAHTPAPAAPAAPAAEPSLQVVTMKLEDYEAQKRRLDDFDRRLADEAQRTREATERANERLIENGKVKEALTAIKDTHNQDVLKVRQEGEEQLRRAREQHLADQKRLSEEKDRISGERTQTEARAKRFALDTELLGALSDYDLVDGAARDIATLVRENFVVTPEGESFATRSVDNKPVKEYLAAWLENRPHYKRSKASGGGTIATPLGLTPRHEGAPAPAAPQPANMGEAAIAQILARRQANPAVAATNMSLGMGLRPLR